MHRLVNKGKIQASKVTPNQQQASDICGLRNYKNCFEQHWTLQHQKILLMKKLN